MICCYTCYFAHAAHFRYCGTPGCKGKLIFDGQSAGLLNMKSFCITYEVLRHHMHQFLTGGYIKCADQLCLQFLYNEDHSQLSGLPICSLHRSTIYTQYTVLCKDHRDAGNDHITLMLSYNQYLLAWYSFLQLLDVNYQEGFSCRCVHRLCTMEIL